MLLILVSGSCAKFPVIFLVFALEKREYLFIFIYLVMITIRFFSTKLFNCNLLFCDNIFVGLMI